MLENLKNWLRNWLRTLVSDKCEHEFKKACTRVVRDQYGERYIEYSLVCSKCGVEIQRFIPESRKYPDEVLENAANNGRPIGSKMMW